MMSGENNNRTTTKTNVVPPSCNAKRWFLQCKIIIKIYLSENKEVTLFVQLNW